MPQYPPHEIEEIKKCFALYVKFPKKRWKEIERAEKNDKEGNKIYKDLKKEYLEKYMPKPDADPHSLTTGPERFQSMDSLMYGGINDEKNVSITCIIGKLIPIYLLAHQHIALMGKKDILICEI